MNSIAKSLLGAAWLLAAGCAPFPWSHTSRCESEKKQILARVISEQKRADQLSHDNQTLTTQLAEAEKQLALLHEQRLGRRESARTADSPTSLTPPPTTDSATGENKLFEGNWRARPPRSLSPSQQ